ncbi:hypothetical protein XELAEV_18017240mg [Xenopus laevis]|uniref:Uncharacterized protein n=1 Tax=Xenopus laevis TaxID=8355 RepID=A0A974DDB1_XENLA|nr:hypothetical protein XELAEV_18017240mg [Xenopus laevis]
MAEQAAYPVISVGYFALVFLESRGERLELGTAASINVFCLFVLIQPLCLALGGLRGIGAYLVTALISYAALPRREKQKRKTEDGERKEKGQKTDKKVKNRKSSNEENKKNDLKGKERGEKKVSRKDQ